MLYRFKLTTFISKILHLCCIKMITLVKKQDIISEEPKEVFDVIIKMRFCRIHKEFFENNVKIIDEHGKKSVSFFKLTQLLISTKWCPACVFISTLGEIF